jgi:hypothetical protein
MDEPPHQQRVVVEDTAVCPVDPRRDTHTWSCSICRDRGPSATRMKVALIGYSYWDRTSRAEPDRNHGLPDRDRTTAARRHPAAHACDERWRSGPASTCWSRTAAANKPGVRMRVEHTFIYTGPLARSWGSSTRAGRPIYLDSVRINLGCSSSQSRSGDPRQCVYFDVASAQVLVAFHTGDMHAP